MPGSANLSATAILNYEDPLVRAVSQTLQANSGLEFLKSAHAYVHYQVAPIYTLHERQPVATTFRKAEGSCSQRLACLEALARSKEIPTRVRALWIHGEFWYPRFKVLRPFLPKHVLVPWPQFHLDGTWIDVDEIFGKSEALASKATGPFTNSGETLFEALENTAVDFLGKTSKCNVACSVDLSRFVLKDGGLFDSRDELFKKVDLLCDTWRGLAFEMLFGGRRVS